MQPLFLETTIQGEKIFAEGSRKECIYNNINNKQACTSTFVLNEFKKTFLNSLIIYHNLLIDSPDSHTALRRSKAYAERIHKRITDIYAGLCDEVGYDKDEILKRLVIMIEDGIMIEFFNGVEEPIINETSCKWANGDPIRVRNRYEFNISCNKKKPNACNIQQFLESNKKELKLLSKSEKITKNKELTKIAEISSFLISGKEKPYGQNCHVHLGDVVITLEAPKDSKIYTTNKKHFKPICEVLGNRDVYEENK